MFPRLEIISSNGGGILTTFQSKSSNPFRQMMLLHFLPLSGGGGGGDPLACKYDGWTDKGNAVATDGRRMWECFCECDAASMGELRSKRKKGGGGNSPVSCVFALMLQRGRERDHYCAHRWKRKREGSFQSGDIINNACGRGRRRRHLPAAAFLSVLTSCFWFCQ